MCVELTDVRSRPAGAHASRPLRVAVAGLGVVGEGVALRLLKETQTFELCAALARDPAKPRDAALDAVPVKTCTDDLFNERPDVVVDAISCGAAGRMLIESALKRGVHVVTANKQAIAGALARLHRLARASGAVLAYSPSVGGGVRMVETVRSARKAGGIVAVTAVLNGTVNFILTEIRRGVPFNDAVRAAQTAGFAEPDPTADLSGEDARAKLSILAYEAFGEEPAPERVEVQALDASRAARFAEDGRVWKQLAVLVAAVGGGVKAGVRYECIDCDHLYGSVEGEENALSVFTEGGGVYSCKGKGAGRAPTVESVFSDLYDIRARIRTETFESSLRSEPALR